MSTADELGEQLEQRERELAELTVRYASLERELAAIKSSGGWAIVQAMSRIGRRLVPQQTLRDRALWQVICAVRAGQRRLAGRGSRVHGGAPQQSAIDVTAARVLPHPRAGTYDVVVFPIIDWTFRFQRPQQIAARLAKAGHRVFYVATGFKAGATAVELRPLSHRVTEVRLPGPPGVLLYDKAMTPKVCVTFVAALRQLRAELNIYDAVCLVDLPFWTPLALQLRDEFGWRVVYDCMDHHAGFPHATAQMLASEERLSRESDLVLATSNNLMAAQRTMGVAAVHVPNAADFEHFRFYIGDPPAAIPRGHGPVIGYYGAISDWFDADLLAALARARPAWQFVLIGHTEGADVDALQALENVHLLGELPYAELPRFLHAFDVCVIPFQKTRLTDATNPVKLFEYLSAGKPVVATDLEELRHYSDFVTLVRGKDAWLSALDAALATDNEAARAARIAFAQNNSWDQRVDIIRRHVAELFPLASIIIVTYNNLEVTRLCLDSLFRRSAYPSIEVIVVDNSSTDGTRDYLQEIANDHSNLQVILQDTNEGFARANNIGLTAANGEYIVFLNNDTVVPAGALSRLLYYLRDESVGMVGPVTNSSGNESRIAVDYTSMEEMHRFAEQYMRAHFGQTFEIRMLALFCVAMRRATVDRVGPLDEQFGIGMFEDDDYALRVKQAGLRVLCAEDVFVHHWGGASFSRLDRDVYDRLFTENRHKFEAKWSTTWQPHRYRDQSALSSAHR